MTKQYQFSDSVLALSGMCQAIHQVQNIARRGDIDDDDFETMIRASLTLEADSTEAIFGGADKLRTGLRVLAEQLGTGAKTSAEFGRYFVNIITLEKQFSNNSELMQIMRTRLNQSIRLQHYHDEIGQEVIDNLASLYQDTLSTLSVRIQVSGDARHLQVANNQARIRALLLSAVRCTLLWRQVGGKKLHLLIRRGDITRTAQAILQDVS